MRGQKLKELLDALAEWRQNFAGTEELEDYHDVVLPETARVIRAYDAIAKTEGLMKRPLWQILVDWVDDILGIGDSLPRGASKRAIRESDEAAGVTPAEEAE